MQISEQYKGREQAYFKHRLLAWNEIPKHFLHVKLDEFVVMPNHVHGIIAITDTVGAKNFSSLHSADRFRSPSKTIGSIVRGFKSGVTKWFRQTTDIVVWQRNYYEHVIPAKKK